MLSTIFYGQDDLSLIHIYTDYCKNRKQTNGFFCEHIPSYVGRGCIIFSQLFFTKNIIYAIKVAC
ncbi:hypothetical protein AZZ65_004802 [Escherichia coli]|nr:hypothetical protein AZZ65_004802 [Escherichia coli]